MTPDRAERVLVYRPGRLGDTLASLPALQAIRERHPRARLTLLTNSQVRRGMVSPWDILERTGIFSEAILYDPRQFSWRDWRDLWLLARRIRRLRPDRLYYMTGILRTTFQILRDRMFFRFLCRIRHIDGMGATALACARDGKGNLVRLPSETDRLLRIAGCSSPETDPGLPLGEKERKKVDLLWREAGLSAEDHPIALGPGSKMPAKRWPLERFESLAERLLSRFPDSRILIIGGQEETEIAQRIRRAAGPRAINCAGRLTVLESAEALRRCSVFVGNDAGAMHLAAAAGTRCVAIFSARDNPGIWEPRGTGHSIIRKDVPCAGCLLTVCHDKELVCLTSVSVEEVFQACLSVSEDIPICRR